MENISLYGFQINRTPIQIFTAYALVFRGFLRPKTHILKRFLIQTRFLMLYADNYYRPIKKDACNLGKNVPKWKGFKSVRMGRAKLSTKGENL